MESENAPVRGDTEPTFQKYLDKLGICYKANAVFCFTCKDYFVHDAGNLPHKCYIGNHPFNGKGQFCIPDFLLVAPLHIPPEFRIAEDSKKKGEYEIYSDQCKKKPEKHVPKPHVLGVIMINENIHYKTAEKINQVADQVRIFNEAGLKVFVILAKEIVGQSDFVLLSMAYYISHAVTNMTLHELNSLSNEYKEKTGSFRQRVGREPFPHIIPRMKVEKMKHGI